MKFPRFQDALLQNMPGRDGSPSEDSISPLRTVGTSYFRDGSDVTVLPPVRPIMVHVNQQVGGTVWYGTVW